ncbi:MAG: S8 family peptidase, partial [Flavobacteriales bacterium]
MNWISIWKITTVFLLFGTTVFAQQNTYWFKADPSVFKSAKWEEISNQWNLSFPMQALSASRNPELLKVYEIKGDCDLVEFKTACSAFGSNIYSIERGPEYQPLFVPNDINNQPGISDYALMLINAPQAWDLTQGDDSVVIAISDQNFEVVHPDLDGKYIHYDVGNTLPTTHGTAVAITAAGKTNNGYGLSSIGFNTSLALYKMNFNEILSASYAGADVINISWTSGCFFSQIEQDVMDEVAENGSFVVSSAGNGNTCGLPDALVYPASYEHVFSVTSVGPTDNHEQWIGDPSSTHNHNDSVDLAAPGYDVAVSPASGWMLNANGTSFAAAYVSGTIALMLSANKCLSNVQIEQILKATAAPLNTINPSYVGKLGAGRLDAYQAVLAASTTWNPITPSFLITDSCLAHDASATLLIQGAQAPFVVDWGNNVSGVYNPNLSTNTYTVHIEGTHGCRLDTS